MDIPASPPESSESRSVSTPAAESNSGGEKPRSHRRHLLPLIAILFLAGGGVFLVRSTSEAPMPLQVRVSSMPVASGIPSAPDVSVRMKTPPVEYQAPGATEWTSITADQTVVLGTRVRTGDAGRAEVRFVDGSVMRLSGGTEIALTAFPADAVRETNIELLKGEVWNRAVNLGGGSYGVASEEALALVRGTAFNARRLGKDYTLSAVAHRVVLVIAGKEISIPEGSSGRLTGAESPDVSETGPKDLDPVWRTENLALDIAHLEALVRATPTEELREELAGAKCAVDPATCPTTVSVLSLRAVRSEIIAEGTVAGGGEARTLTAVWTRDGVQVASHEITIPSGSDAVTDRLPLSGAGAYAVELRADRVAVATATLTVEPPRSSLPLRSSVPQRSTTPPASSVEPVSSAEPVSSVEFVSSAPVVSSQPDPARACPDPGQCPYGYTYDSNNCRICFVSTVPSAPQCPDPGQCPYGYTYDMKTGCRICVQAPAAGPICGNKTIELGEQCEPPNTRVCSASCQTITAPPATCTPNCRLPMTLQCTSGGLDCDGDGICEKCL